MIKKMTNAQIYALSNKLDSVLNSETRYMPAKIAYFIHKNKTAALIQAAKMIGAVLAGAGVGEVQRIEKCAYNIGIAFQIQDDILDVIGNQEELGKPIGSDEKNHKQTYVTLNGLEESKEQVKKLSEEAVQIIDSFGGDSTFLKELILSLIHRSK